MKKSILLLALLSTSAFAQINYDQINQTNANAINSAHAQARANRRAAVKDFFTIDAVDATKFPKAGNYSKIEFAQTKLLSCIRDIVQKNKGGYDAPSVAQTILLSAMEGDSISKNETVIANAEAECHTAFKKLYNFSNRNIDNDKLTAAFAALKKQSLAEQKTAATTKAFSDRTSVMCKVIKIEAEAYAILGGGAALGDIKCIYSDGRVRNYLGVSLKAGVGLGALIGVDIDDTESNDDMDVADGTLAAAYYSDTDSDTGSDTHYAIGLGKDTDANGNQPDHGLEIGLGFDYCAMSAGLAVRTLNGKSRWELIINQLN